jgi:hypothetical protein
MTNWFYQLEGQEALGPVPTETLKTLAKKGILKPTDLIWKDGYEKWVKAKRLKGLFSLEEGTAHSINPLKSDKSKKKQNLVNPRKINEPSPKADLHKWEVKKPDGKIYFVYHNRDLKRLVSYGELKPLSLIRKCGKIKWHEASEIKGLFQEQKDATSKDTINISAALASSTQDNVKYPIKPILSDNNANLIESSQEISNQTLISPAFTHPDDSNIKPADNSFSGKQKVLFCLVSFSIFSCCFIPSWINSLRILQISLKRVEEIAFKFEGTYEETKENSINQIAVFINNQGKANAEEIKDNNEEKRAANINLRSIFGQGLATIDPQGFNRTVNKAEQRVRKADELIKNGKLAFQASDFIDLVKNINTIIQHDSYHIQLKVRLGRMFELDDIKTSIDVALGDLKPEYNVFLKKLKSFTILIPKSFVENEKINKDDIKGFLSFAPSASIIFEKK